MQHSLSGQAAAHMHAHGGGTGGGGAGGEVSSDEEGSGGIEVQTSDAAPSAPWVGGEVRTSDAAPSASYWDPEPSRLFSISLMWEADSVRVWRSTSQGQAGTRGERDRRTARFDGATPSSRAAGSSLLCSTGTSSSSSSFDSSISSFCASGSGSSFDSSSGSSWSPLRLAALAARVLARSLRFGIVALCACGCKRRTDQSRRARVARALGFVSRQSAGVQERTRGPATRCRAGALRSCVSSDSARGCTQGGAQSVHARASLRAAQRAERGPRARTSFLKSRAKALDSVISQIGRSLSACALGHFHPHPLPACGPFFFLWPRGCHLLVKVPRESAAPRC
jgi:hypothetical protein